MPPKQQAPVASTTPKNFTIRCKVDKVVIPPSPVVDPVAIPVESVPPVPLPVDGLRLRIFSSWCNISVTTPILGTKDSPAWTPDADNDTIKSINFTYQFDAEVTVAHDKLNSFHSDANIYCFAFYVSPVGLKPLGFLVLDCSAFLIDSTTLHLHKSLSEDYSVLFSVSNEKSLLSWEQLIPLEPVVLTIKNLGSFPVYPKETDSEAIVDTYFYGRLQLGVGENCVKEVMFMPSDKSTSTRLSAGSTSDKYPVGTKLILLPGLYDISRFHDVIASSTFAVQLLQDDLLTRVLDNDRMKEYCALLSSEPGGVGLPFAPVSPRTAAAATTAAPAAGGKKGAAAPATKATPAATTAAAAGADNGVPFHPIPTAATKSDHFLLDKLKLEMRHGKEIRSHGLASFRLERLLEQSRDLLTKFTLRRDTDHHAQQQQQQHVTVEEELVLEVRLEKPSRPEKWDLPSDLSLKHALQRAVAARGKQEKPRVIKQPPRHELFLVNGTYLSVTATLHRSLHREVQQVDSASPFPAPLTLSTTNKDIRHEHMLHDDRLQHMLKETPFMRMVVVFRYSDDDTLRMINDGLNAVNSHALPDIQGTIRSYSLTKDELEKSRNGTLDIVSGFMIIDDDLRLLLLEGLAAPDKAMEWLYLDYLPRLQDNDDNLKILCNPEVLFKDRLYPEFSPDLKRIRVRGKLKKLARRPEIYNRKQVEEICFLAMDSLMTLRRMEDMKTAKQLDVFPTAEALNKLELLYGEAISRADMDGSLRREFIQAHEERRSRPSSRASGTQSEASPSTLQRTRSRKEFEFTDCRNAPFEEHLRNRPAHRIDYLAEQRLVRKQAWLDMLQRREERNTLLTATIRSVLGLDSQKNERASSAHRNRTDDNADHQQQSNTIPKIYLYSNQSLNYKVKAWDQMREQVAKDHNATYTFSRDFMSQNVSTVDEEKLKKQREDQIRSEFLTPKGFLYPKPKTRKELLLHPQRPSEARIEDLKEPFADALDRNPKAEEAQKSPTLRAREKGFLTQIPNGELFGALNLPQFEQPFELRLVGDREHLPRGKLFNEGEKDPKFFRSVHLGGENQAKIIQEALEQEKEEWKSKVVVDDIAFKVGGFKVRDRPLQADKCKDILHDEPHRKELKHLREMTAHRGYSLAYTTTPLSILNNEPYAPQAGAKLLMRGKDESKFITTTGLLEDDPHHAEDFHRFIHRDEFNPKIMSVVTKRKHPAQDRSSMECTGPRWDGA